MANTDMQNSLHVAFVKELQDIYSAENQIVKALPKMIAGVDSQELKQAFEKHLKQTKVQIERLDEIGDELNLTLKGEECVGMKGLLKEGEEILKDKKLNGSTDAALIGAAQRVEHYEIAAYGTARAYAKLMNHSKAVKLLSDSIEEEGDTDKKLTEIAMRSVNQDALEDTDTE